MRQKIRQHIGIALMLVVGLGMISHFLWLDVTFAADPVQTTLLQDLQSKLNTYNIIMNVVYILLRPGLILAGMSLDNNMVYGTFFKLDAPLWVIWNIIKNFANFALWFMVLVEIIKLIFKFDDSATAASNITKVISKCIIAGIGIQASWFLLAATVDLSTVATYGIGWLPLSVLGTSDDASIKCLANQKILGVSSTMDFTNSAQNGVANQWFKYYYYIDAQGGRKNYSPCELKDSYVIGRQYGWWTSPSSIASGEIYMEPYYCILWANKVVKFKNEIGREFFGQWASPAPNTPESVIYSQNLANNKGAISATGTYTRSGLVQDQKVFDINDKASYDISDGRGIAPLNKIPPNGWGFDTFNDSWVLTMKGLLDSSKGMMWPLISLYSSILNFAQFNIQTSNGDDRALVIEAMIKTLLAVAMLLPMLLTALVMLVRVWILWIVIAISPFFMLKRSFEMEIDIPILKYKRQDLLKIIFAPVVIVFAISLCIIFMSLLVNGFNKRDGNDACGIDTKQMYSDTFGVDEYIYSTGQTLKVGNLFEISNQAFGNSTWGDARNYIGWILVNLFGIGVVWMILMAALSFSSELGDAVHVKGIGEWATKTVGTIPFIPVPTPTGFGAVWAGTFKKISERAMVNMAEKTQLDKWFAEGFNEFATGEKADGSTSTTTTTTVPSAATTLSTEHISKIDNAISSGGSITQVRDDIIKSNPSLTASVDNHIAESIAKLAADGSKTFTDRASIDKTIENFKTASKTMTTTQLANIFNDKDSKLKYVLAPKLDEGTSTNIKFNDKAWGTFTKTADGDISLSDLKDNVAASDQSAYTELDTVTRLKIEDFMKDLEEKITKNPANKTKLETIKNYFPKA